MSTKTRPTVTIPTPEDHKRKADEVQRLLSKFPHPETLVAMWSGNARKVLETRIALKDEVGTVIETPEQTIWRTAVSMATAEREFNKKMKDDEIISWATKFYDLMIRQVFLPNSPTLVNAGKPDLLSQAACFVLPMKDSLDKIFDTVKDSALIQKAGGGTGYNFSRLRPRGSRVGSTRGVSSGPISFMEVLGASTGSIRQGGVRRGANMGMLEVDHPDILEFIECKSHENRNNALENFNISVLVTDEFMQSVKDGTDYELVHPQTGTNLDPNGNSVGKLNAREVWNKMIQGAWGTGDPGVVFLDRLERDNPTPAIGKLECTNPCGEQPLLPYEACNLGSINVAKFVTDEGFDFESLTEVAKLAARMLDNTIEMSWYPLPEIFKIVRGNRKIGVGVMGFGDALIKMGMAYNSDEAIELAEEISRAIQKGAELGSMELADERGPFPFWEKSVFAKGEFIERNLHRDKSMHRRNALVTTIAPTGTIGILADAVCAGIEPLFAVAYMRTTSEGMKLPYVHPEFERIAREEGWYTDELAANVAMTGSVQGLEGVPEQWQKVFVTAHDVTPEWHVRMQAAFQKYVDNAVSKTVNFSNDATPEDVAEVYELAYELGCKGVTIFRDGSLNTQVLTVGTSEKNEAPVASSSDTVELGQVRTKMKVPQERRGRTVSLQTPLGKMHLTVNEVDDKPIELFATVGKTGSDIGADAEAIGRLASLVLQLGGNVSLIAKTLRGIGGSNTVGFGANKVSSMPDAIGKYLQETYLSEAEKAEVDQKSFTLGVCPDCGKAAMVMEAGCSTCKECSYSAC